MMNTNCSFIHNHIKLTHLVQNGEYLLYKINQITENNVLLILDFGWDQGKILTENVS